MASTTGAMRSRFIRRRVKLIQRKLLRLKVEKFKSNLSIRRRLITKTEIIKVVIEIIKEVIEIIKVVTEITRVDLIKTEERIMIKRTKTMKNKRALKVKKERPKELLKVMIIRRETMKEEEVIEEMIEEVGIEEKGTKKSLKKKKSKVRPSKNT